MAYVKNGEIVLNIGASATRRLTIDNDGVRFSARFSGTSQEVAVPMSAVAGIFAKETGYGFAFTVSQNPAASLAAATAPPEPDIEAALDSDSEGKPGKPRSAARASRARRTCRSSSSPPPVRARRVGPVAAPRRRSVPPPEVVVYVSSAWRGS